MLEEILEIYYDEEILIANGFDYAVIGIDNKDMRLIYSVRKCIEMLLAEGLSHDDAIEHFEYNVRNSYMGKQTPIWCDDYFL